MHYLDEGRRDGACAASRRRAGTRVDRLQAQVFQAEIVGPTRNAHNAANRGW
jgi:hypothetical protein